MSFKNSLIYIYIFNIWIIEISSANIFIFTNPNKHIVLTKLIIGKLIAEEIILNEFSNVFANVLRKQ